MRLETEMKLMTEDKNFLQLSYAKLHESIENISVY